MHLLIAYRAQEFKMSLEGTLYRYGILAVFSTLVMICPVRADILHDRQVEMINAVRSGNISQMEKLLKTPEISVHDVLTFRPYKHLTYLELAAGMVMGDSSCNLKSAAFLIQQGANPNQWHSNSILFYLADRVSLGYPDCLQVMQLLLDHGADRNGSG